MSAIASQITGVSMAYWTVCSAADQSKHQSSESLAFVRGIHRCPVNIDSGNRAIGNKIQWNSNKCNFCMIFEGINCKICFFFMPQDIHSCDRVNCMVSVNWPIKGSGNGLPPVIGVKPLPEPMLTYYQLALQGQNSAKFQSKYTRFNQKEAEENIVCKIDVCPGLNWQVNHEQAKDSMYVRYMNWLTEAELHMHASPNYAIIGSYNGLSPVRCPAIFWSNYVLLLAMRPREHTSVKFEPKHKNFHRKEHIYRLHIGGHSVPVSMC